jgi:leucyl/phenylalanyl-tRNA--protein transferase
MPIYQLVDQLVFPDPNQANEDGLLAVGGDLSEDRLVKAYKSGVFPWFSEGEQILWWSPNPRFVLFPRELKVAKTLKKEIRKKNFRITFNEAFDEVIEYCANVKRKDQQGTWITQEMKTAYSNLHKKGVAISVEAWQGKELVGGLYGLRLGHVYFGESMFSIMSNASKVAFVALMKKLQEEKCQVIDCQVFTEHLQSFGARMIPRDQYLNLLDKNI